MQREGYLLELARYVVLNPVRAGMCAMPGLWSWSRYCAMVGDAAPPPWLQTAWLLEQFSSDMDTARVAYVDHGSAAAPPLAHFVAMADRDTAMRRVFATGCYTLKEIGAAFGVHYATVSRVVRQASSS